MQREYSMIHKEPNGTYSGIESKIRIEDWCVFVRGIFLIEGYYETSDEREMIEMLFIEYCRNGRVIRRVFSQCTFSFIGFSVEEILRFMSHLVSVKPGNIEFGFFDCRVLLDGERFNYGFPRPSYRVPSEIWAQPSLVHTNVFARYHLKEARIEVKGESKEFSDDYQWRILTRRSKIAIDFVDFQAAMILSMLKQSKPSPPTPSYRIVIDRVDM